jgi:hypothetical protein
MHVDRYRVPFGVALGPGRSRPDLIGPRDPDRLTEWIVMEAKGRTHGLDPDVFRTARLQKRQVLRIRRQIPRFFVGSAAHFSSGVLEIEAVDPPAGDDEGTELFGDDDGGAPKRRFVTAYYGPLIELLDTEEQEVPDDPGREVLDTQEQENGPLRLRELPIADVIIGMSVSRFHTIRDFMRGDVDEIDLTSETSPQRSGRPVRDPRMFVGPDGVVVQLGESWGTERMQLEPWARVR